MRDARYAGWSYPMAFDTRAAVLHALVLAWAATAHAQSETVTYMHTDGVGSVRLLTNESSQIVARYDYLPFGELCTTACGNAVSSATTRQFGGKERDPETALDYFGARYLAAGGGRFTTVDPALDFDEALAHPQQWNRYVYALNNPLTLGDNDGRSATVVGGLVGFAVGGVTALAQGRSWREVGAAA